MKKLDIYYRCNKDFPRSCATFTTNVEDLENIKWPKENSPVQIDVVKKEIETTENGEEVISAETTTYMLGHIEPAMNIITKPLTYVEAVQCPIKEATLPSTKERYISVRYQKYRMPHPVRFYKRCPNHEMVVYQPEQGPQQACPKTADIKVCSSLSDMKMAFLDDIIDYFAENEKTKENEKAYTKSDKLKGTFHVFSK